MVTVKNTLSQGILTIWEFRYIYGILKLRVVTNDLLMISELRDTAKVSLEDYLKMEREKKLNEESLMNQVTQLQNDKDELKTEIFKLKHKVEKVRVFRVYFDL